MWQKIKDFFSDSETIAWARVQTAIGAIAAALTFIDPHLLAPILGDWFPWFLVANGLATEWLRRRRAGDL